MSEPRRESMMDGRQGDGVTNPPGEGESTGGAYPNPHSGKDEGGFAGGQGGKGYEGPNNPNATTEPEGPDDADED